MSDQKQAVGQAERPDGSKASEMPTFAQAIDRVNNLRLEFKDAYEDTSVRAVQLSGQEYQDLRRACLVLKGTGSAMLRALRLVVESGPLNNGMRDENTLAIAREALALAEESHV